MFVEDHDLADILKIDGHPISDNRLHLSNPPLGAVGVADSHARGEFGRHGYRVVPLGGVPLAYRGAATLFRHFLLLIWQPDLGMPEA